MSERVSERAASLLRRYLAPAHLRPPGARDEPMFDALCIRCGCCMEVCPHRALRPAATLHGAGTPFIEPRREPCWLCMRCPPACRTGALAPVREPRDVRMGRARIDPGACYAFQGVLCRTCIDACPFHGEAIRQDLELRPVVTDRCVGCGICERLCPAPGSAIRVAAGQAGAA